jgi:hypothetical protein
MMPTLNLSEAQLDILRHMLGVNDLNGKAPAPYRNYYCACPGDKQLHELQGLGAVEMYHRTAKGAGGDYEWFRCTDAGSAAALASCPKPLTGAKKRYRAFLEISDVYPDLTFREFLTHPHFAERRS